ncbi:MAG: hypothetical protein Q7V63_05115 [Gammaproteobacteria bacterium]|nr:hypothetical protein [Gammaproteobacteria bacterium]
MLESNVSALGVLGAIYIISVSSEASDDLGLSLPLQKVTHANAGAAGQESQVVYA